MYVFLAEAESSFCLEVLLLLQLTWAEHCWQASTLYASSPLSVVLYPSENKLLVTELDIKYLGLLICESTGREFL